VVGQAKRDPYQVQILVVQEIVAIGPRKWKHHRPRFLTYLHTKVKQKTRAGRSEEAAMGSHRRLIPRAMTEGVGRPQVLQDDAHHLQDDVGRASILRDP
jgi:hypothetical protein